MSGVNLNISSKAIEQAIDSARNFLGKLIMPAIEEAGLLIKDRITVWRFERQVKILNRAKEICEKNNISTGQISLKLLCPLLEYSSLEEDETLEEKWAILLSNMVDSEQNLKNHVFPYLLSQLSTKEFLFLEKAYDNKVLQDYEDGEELRILDETKESEREKFNSEIASLKDRISLLRRKSRKDDELISQLEIERYQAENNLRSLNDKEYFIRYKIGRLLEVFSGDLENFEVSNLIRLGLLKEVNEYYANTRPLEIPNDRSWSEEPHVIDVDIDVERITEFFFTELGEHFVHACKEKLAKVRKSHAAPTS